MATIKLTPTMRSALEDLAAHGGVVPSRWHMNHANGRGITYEALFQYGLLVRSPRILGTTRPVQITDPGFEALGEDWRRVASGIGHLDAVREHAERFPPKRDFRAAVVSTNDYNIVVRNQGDEVVVLHDGHALVFTTGPDGGALRDLEAALSVARAAARTYRTES